MSNNIVVTVYPLPATPLIVQSGDSLFSNASSGNQWYNTVTGIVIGATGRSFIPPVNGSYYVIVTDPNGCRSDTSNIINYIQTDIYQNQSFHFNLFPNPVTSVLNFEMPAKPTDAVFLKLINSIGQTVWQKQYRGGTVKIDCRFFSNGLYFLLIGNDNITNAEKIVVNR
jgi:hypothetical protein